MKLLKYLPPKQRRLSVLVALTAVFAGWSIILPPTEKLDSIDFASTHDKSLDSHGQDWHLLEVNKTNYLAWDLPVTLPKKQEVVPVVKKEIKSVPIVKKKVIEVMQQPEIVHYEPPKPVMDSSRIKYLGQVIDASGLQVFLIIDDSSVVMRPQRIYQQTWKIVSIDDYEVRLMHLPTQQIMRVTKS